MRVVRQVGDDVTKLRPVTQGRPSLELYFKSIPKYKDIDYGPRLTSAQFSCMLNGGYVVKIVLHDPHFNTIAQLIDGGYFLMARNQPLEIRFRLKASYDGGDFPHAGTREQIAYVTKIHTYGTSSDMASVEFTAIDPASYLLNRGTGAGKSYQGKVSNVIKQVVNEYAPDIQLDISDTIDSDKNRFWMMRQNPQTFINSLLQWSSPLTQSRTQWITASDGMNLSIKAQADVMPRERAYYTFWEPEGATTDTIRGWNTIADNTLTLVQTQIITQGLSVVSGSYFDNTVDENQAFVVQDSTTPDKITATTTQQQSFTKPSESSKLLGATSVPAIPELYSGGELGLSYDEYIDGHARDLWLNMTRNLIRCRLRIWGHGEWSDGNGLGIDTVKLMWIAAPAKKGEEPQEYFMTGNWIVYGFEHDLTPNGWYTYVHIARFDWDAIANTFPKRNQSL